MAIRYTEEQYKALTGMEPPKKPDKYHRSPREMRTVDGIVFASLKEARDYFDLKRRQMAGEIRNLRTQVPFRLEVEGKKVGKYVADFVYEEKQEGEWKKVVADSKPDTQAMTPEKRRDYFNRPAVKLYLIKKNLMRELYGIEVKEL